MEAGRGLDAVAKDYANWYISRLRWLEARLGEPGRSEFLCSQRFTVADICITYALLHLIQQMEGARESLESSTPVLRRHPYRQHSGGARES